MNYIKKILLLVTVVFTALQVTAQSGSNTPFSQYGIGLGSQPYNMPLTARLGGVAITRAGNNFVNPFNPASYASVQPQSFVFDMAFSVQTASLSDASARLTDFSTQLAYIAFAMPVTKWWKIGGGIMPYSNTDYESVSSDVDPVGGPVKTRYYGSGSVSEAFIGSAFNIIGGDNPDSLSLQAGFNIKLLTGSQQRAISYEQLDAATTYKMSSRKIKDTRVRNLEADAGVQLRLPLGGNRVLGAGLTFAPGIKQNIDEEAVIYTYFSESSTLGDTVFPLRGQSGQFVSTIEIPTTVGLGLSLESGRWLLAADAVTAPWSGVKYTEGAPLSIFGQNSLRYAAYGRYALAAELKGDRNAANYLSRISWSAGVHYEHGKIAMTTASADLSLDEWGCGFGATLPMRKGRSLLTISVAYSHLGSTNVLLQESLTFGIALSSCETWFVKRKYN
ncbi:MAG: hypothetical protein K5650_04630 [Bacteroidales bacterium]|nr:hypothetical protein [Bacteroidales bacterium]